MKDFFEYHGDSKIMGSRNAIRLAFSRGLIDDGNKWMEMVKNRVKSSHTYDQAMADDVAHKLNTQYYTLFIEFDSK